MKAALWLVSTLLLLLSVSNATQSEEELILLKEMEAKIELLDQMADSSLQKRAVCPGGGSCSGHGSCLPDGTCVCNQGYAGDDCSYVVIAATSGTKYSNQHVTSKSWIFYTISTTGGGLTVVINQTVVGGDADTYILQNDIPTKSKYAFRDISGKPNYVINIPAAGTNTWYIGVFGFLDTIYQIQITTSSQCPLQNNCNPPNGVCIGPNQCQCAPGFSGSDCSQGVNQLVLNVAQTKTVNIGTWNFFMLNVTSASNTLVFAVTQTTNGDADMYVSFGHLPALHDYDYKDISLGQNFSLSVNQPNIGTYYIGLYGYQTTTYTITASTSVGCPSQCSNHGTCSSNSACNCNSGYSGTYCQTMVGGMNAGVSYGGYVSGNSWNYYHFQASTVSNLVVYMNHSAGNTDCDLYVKSGANPGIFNYDYRDIGFSQSATITIPNPGSATWYIGVYGFKACQYTVSATISNACPGTPTCSGHGTCTSAGTCVCQSGYGGVDCSVANIPVLTSGATITGSSINMTYYQINLQGSSFATIDLLESNGTQGNLWLYISKDEAPTTGDYDYVSKETNTGFHSIQLQFASPQTSFWIIGVYASPFANGQAQSYSLAAWTTPF